MLVSETTSGTTHAAEASTYSTIHSSTPSQAHSSATSGGGRGEFGGGESQKQENQRILPEDIGTQTASLLLEEIVKVMDAMRHAVCIIASQPNCCNKQSNLQQTLRTVCCAIDRPDVLLLGCRCYSIRLSMVFKAGCGPSKAGHGINKAGCGPSKAGHGINKAGCGPNKAGCGPNKAGRGLNKAGCGPNKAGRGPH